MRRILALAAIFSCTVLTSANGQSGRPDPACARDISRFCRSVMDKGDDYAILACLNQNRARLSTLCRKVLTDHGQ
jgi:hypothetical protein